MNDELAKRRAKKPPNLDKDKIRKAVKAITSCNKPLKGGGKCSKPSGHWGRCK